MHVNTMRSMHWPTDMCSATRQRPLYPRKRTCTTSPCLLWANSDAKAFTNAETTDLYLGFRSLGCTSTKISSDNRTANQLVSMKTDTPAAKWPAAGSNIPSATISKKTAVNAWM